MKKTLLSLALLACAAVSQAAEFPPAYLGVTAGGFNGGVNADHMSQGATRDAVGVLAGVKVGKNCGAELEFAGSPSNGAGYSTLAALSGTYEYAIPDTKLSVMGKLGAGQVYASGSSGYHYHTTGLAGVAVNAALSDGWTLRVGYTQLDSFAQAHNLVGYSSVSLLKSF